MINDLDFTAAQMLNQFATTGASVTRDITPETRLILRPAPDHTVQLCVCVQGRHTGEAERAALRRAFEIPAEATVKRHSLRGYGVVVFTWERVRQGNLLESYAEKTAYE